MTLLDILSDFRLLLMVVIATIVGVIAGLVEYKLGSTQRQNIFEHTDRLTPEMLERFQNAENTLGSPVLILSGLPILGPPVSIAAGVIGSRLRTFIMWGTIGRLLSNTLILMIFGQTALWIGKLAGGC